ncbi:MULTISPECIES: superoxide dismutase family protein [Gordonia]|uniref:Superoxide dismutase SodC n=2 Tax=Gordonia TaxID=2053 RepID=L7LN75_9ACTN|nr:MULTISPECIES: superoxide dismutase family protein [Gordonia]AUH67830.1 superoxide dismutase family protein [Gordonia sp. YC-JH1]KJR05764.1 superoxide dismutase [Gordonia sihwensis]KXT58275.1 superoxide dismutase [Gordonia sp. QH-12]MBY4570853.1 superoxide dismutase [Gordonia sihwensis]WFN92474.1 superoxide dismutase family protein [Gordonia sihwensis]
MTVRSTNRASTVRVMAAVAAAGGAALALSACTPNEQPSDVPGTTPAVVTGDQVAPGDVVNADGIPASAQSASTTLVNKDGNRVGFVSFSQEGEAVKVSMRVAGVKPGEHGIHIHTVGKCEPATGFSTAGGHFQADGHTGKPESGDLATLNVLKDGTASASTTTDAFTVQDIRGKAVILHDLADGGSEAPRLACGVISQTS